MSCLAVPQNVDFPTFHMASFKETLEAEGEEKKETNETNNLCSKCFCFTVPLFISELGWYGPVASIKCCQIAFVKNMDVSKCVRVMSIILTFPQEVPYRVRVTWWRDCSFIIHL